MFKHICLSTPTDLTDALHFTLHTLFAQASSSYWADNLERRQTPSSDIPQYKDSWKVFKKVCLPPVNTKRDDLSVDKLHALSAIVNSVDVAQQKAEILFNENVVYFIDDSLRRSVMGVAKPTLSQQRLNIISNPIDQQWYRDFSKRWLAYALTDSSIPFSVNIPILNQDMATLCQKVPNMGAYLADTNNNWASKYSDYLLSDEFQQDWAASVRTNPPAIVESAIKEITSKLDILDPTTTTSREVVMRLQVAVIIRGLYLDIDEIRHKRLFQTSLNMVIEDAKRSSEQSEEMHAAHRLIEAAGGTAELSAMLIGAYLAVPKTEVTTSVTVTGDNIWKRGLSYFSENIKSLATKPVLFNTIKRLLAGFLYASAAVSVLLGLYTFNEQSGPHKAAFVVNTVILVTSLIVGRESVDVALTTVVSNASSWINSFVTRNFTPRFANGFKTLCNRIFTTESVAKFFETRAIPSLILVSAAFIVYDLVKDVESGNKGAFSLDFLAGIFTLGEAVVLFIGLSWSGPVAILLAIAGGIALGLKYLLFPDKTPAEKFKERLDAKYRNVSLRLESSLDLPVLCDISLGNGQYLAPGYQGLHSVKFHPTSDPFQVLRAGENQILLVNPLNTIGGTPSYLSCRSGHLSTYPINAGPAVETEVWYLVDAGQANTYHLMSWNSQFLHIRGDGIAELNANNKTAVTFYELDNWFGVDKLVSLMTGYTLQSGNAIFGKNQGLAVIEDGDSSAIAYTLFDKVPIGINGYLQLLDNGAPAIYDSNGQLIPTDIEHRLVNLHPDHITAPLALVFAANPSDSWCPYDNGPFTNITTAWLEDGQLHPGGQCPQLLQSLRDLIYYDVPWTSITTNQDEDGQQL
eukprot:gene20009-23976_t